MESADIMEQYAIARHEAAERGAAAQQRIAEISEQQKHATDPERRRALVMELCQAEYEKDSAEAMHKKLDAEYNLLRKQRAKELEKQAAQLVGNMEIKHKYGV